MLVLLVIFMVTAPILQQGVDRRPAEDARRRRSPAQEEQLVVDVAKSGQVYLNDTPIALAELRAKLVGDRAASARIARCCCAPIAACRTAT